MQFEQHEAIFYSFKNVSLHIVYTSNVTANPIIQPPTMSEA